MEKVRIPQDRDGRQKNFAFITFRHEVSVPYAINLFRGTALYHKTLSLQCRASTALLPPPIRCANLDPSFDFLSQTNVKQQFETMTETMRHLDQRDIQAARQMIDSQDKLTVASLQGNWTHRHHPYSRNEREDRRHQGRGRDERNDYNKKNNHRNRQTSNWRERDRRIQNQGHNRDKKTNYYRGD